MNLQDAAVIIPCHNEELSIATTIRDIQQHFPGARIIVVDNCSSDDTYKVASNLGVRVIRAEKKGKGFAVRKGFDELKKIDFSVAFLIDGDATYSVLEFLEGHHLVVEKGYDMVVGNRIPDLNQEVDRNIPYRRLHVSGNRHLSVINKILFGLDIKDTLSGWRAFSPGFVHSFPGIGSAFEIEVELNAHAYVLKSLIGNVNVTYKGRIHGSESKLRTFSDGFRILKRLSQLFRSERPLVAYTWLALPWFFLSTILIVRALSNFINTNEVQNFPSLIAGVAAFVVSALLWAVGMIIENIRISRSQSVWFIYRNY
jgi:glycosyltransferase involved in cell wall biosynthesis